MTSSSSVVTIVTWHYHLFDVVGDIVFIVVILGYIEAHKREILYIVKMFMIWQFVFMSDMKKYVNFNTLDNQACPGVVGVVSMMSIMPLWCLFLSYISIFVYHSDIVISIIKDCFVGVLGPYFSHILAVSFICPRNRLTVNSWQTLSHDIVDNDHVVSAQ